MLLKIKLFSSTFALSVPRNLLLTRLQILHSAQVVEWECAVIPRIENYALCFALILSHCAVDDAGIASGFALQKKGAWHGVSRYAAALYLPGTSGRRGISTSGCSKKKVLTSMTKALQSQAVRGLCKMRNGLRASILSFLDIRVGFDPLLQGSGVFH